MLRKVIYLLILILLLKEGQSATAPFIPFNELHPTLSQFEFNLILNENRNIPIVMLQYSEDKTLKIIKGIIENAFQEEKDISFALLIDCRKFAYDLNNTLGVCRGFSEYVKDESDTDEEGDSEKVEDDFLKLNLFTPNPTRIIEKGHTLAKNHDIQNLRELGVNVNSQFLAKVIRNEIPEYVKYIEDNHDLDDFTKINSQFRLSKGPKLIYFDQNLQSPLFLRKLAINLDGWIQIGVSDSSKIAANYGCWFEDLVLLEYDFQQKVYTHQKIAINLDKNPLKEVLQNPLITSYTNIRKPRDILLDFEHKNTVFYNFTSLKQLNQLLTHGRIIVLQISQNEDSFECPNLVQVGSVSGPIFNYACSSRKGIEKLLTLTQFDSSKNNWHTSFFLIDGSLKNTKIVSSSNRNLYDFLPKTGARQQISSSSQGQLCLNAARSSERQSIFFYFNEKTHAKSINLLKYLASLGQVNSILYFCQFYVPDAEVTKQYHLNENTLFTLKGQGSNGQLQKVQHTKVQDFLSIKMFLREIAITRIMNVYEDKIVKNEINEIKSAEELTKNCFSNQCIIALIETGKFHQETELKILKEMKLAYSEEGYKFFWIDGVCHYEVGKQLKLTEKGSKLIDRSYLFLYQEKGNAYSLWKAPKLNKFWDKKAAFRWLKSLRNPSAVSRIKFGIDLQDKACVRQTVKETEKVSTPSKKNVGNKRVEVNQDQL